MESHRNKIIGDWLNWIVESHNDYYTDMKIMM